MIYCLFCFHSTFSRWHTKVLADTPLPVIIRHFKNSQTIRNKKDVGVCLSALISKIRLSHCLQEKISNVKTAHVRRYTYTHYHLTQFTHNHIRKDSTHKGTPYYIYKGNKSGVGIQLSTHADALCCITAVLGFKVATFDLTDSNVRKRPFETGRTTALGSRSIDVLMRPSTRGQAGNRTRMHKIRCKDKHIFRTTKEILEKITICPVFY